MIQEPVRAPYAIRGALGLGVLVALAVGCLVIYDYDDHQSPAPCEGTANPDACRSCRESVCQAKVDSCRIESIGDCPKWLACVDRCTAADATWCFSNCGYENNPLRNTLKTCLCEECAAECSCFDCL